jgi:hypothetical protein
LAFLKLFASLDMMVVNSLPNFQGFHKKTQLSFKSMDALARVAAEEIRKERLRTITLLRARPPEET